MFFDQSHRPRCPVPRNIKRYWRMRFLPSLLVNSVIRYDLGNKYASPTLMAAEIPPDSKFHRNTRQFRRWSGPMSQTTSPWTERLSSIKKQFLSLQARCSFSVLWPAWDIKTSTSCEMATSQETGPVPETLEKNTHVCLAWEILKA